MRAMNPISTAPPSPTAPTGPLYVDMDGTLVATDTLWESLCLLARRHPKRLWSLPGWLFGGKANLKARIAERVVPDAKRLPYRGAVLDFLRAERAAGRRLVLATAAHERVAHAVSDHLGLFDAVLASDATNNLRGTAKLAALRAHGGAGAFGYLGDSRADLPVWAGSARAVVLEPRPALRRAVERLGVPFEVLPARRSVGTVHALFRALRPHQWAKNALLFVPLILAQQVDERARELSVFLAFLAFCAVSSAGYLFNDMLDIEADRGHATKRNRPFAAGTLSIPAGLAALAALLASGFGIALGLVSVAFTAMLAAYLVATVTYSLYLKERLFLDVLVLASLYTLRVLAGGVAGGIEVSTWLLAFSVFFFLSLALVKRYVELLQRADVAPGAEGMLAGRAYQKVDTGLVETMGIASGYVSILVLCLYVSRKDVTRYYASPDVLWLITPLMLYWISRVWLLARRGRLTADPVLFATTDRVSYGILAAIAAIGLIAVFWGRTA